MFMITDCYLEGETFHKEPDNKQRLLMPYTFKLYDDDGEKYFKGISCDNSSEGAFDPLDLFGESYGCTDIKYMYNGQWSSL